MKSKPTRSRLTWDEIRKIEASWKQDKEGPAAKDITKLIKHIRFVEHLFEEAKEKVRAYESLNKSKL